LRRAQALNRQNFTKFFDNLDKLIQEYGFTGPRIFNMDETGVTVVPNKHSRVIAEKGQSKWAR
jgi:hypothetical protein